MHTNPRNIYRLQKVEKKCMSIYVVVESYSWVTLTQLNHVNTLLNIIVHLVGRLSGISILNLNCEMHFFIAACC